jgi:hypothetical protein
MYQVKEVQDVSRPVCKRYIGHIEVDKKNKTNVKRAIVGATNEMLKEKDPCHVVWLYVWHKGKILCRTMWTDKEFTAAPLPLPLDYNDHEGDIGIVWY